MEKEYNRKSDNKVRSGAGSFAWRGSQTAAHAEGDVGQALLSAFSQNGRS